MLDMDKLNESEKERLDDDEDEVDELQACIIANRKLMEQQQDRAYKERVLDTLENNFDFRETANQWRKKVRRIAVQKELNEKKQK